MIFSSIFFLYVFLPIVLVLYYIVPFKIKNFVLLLVSLVFYAWGEPVYVLLMIFSIAINFVLGLEIEHFQLIGRMDYAKVIMIIDVILNLFVLGFYKYYGFILDNINHILPNDIQYHQLALPIGISFYTFQTLSYVIDVYRGKVDAQHNIINFGAYVTMFPQLIAGPIVRYSDIEAQLQERTLSRVKFGDGVIWFIRGLGKKVLIANNIGAIFDGIQAMGASNMTTVTAWIGCFAYTMQIFFDFSGYSDMAIGLGKMLGFDFVKNFDYPYVSKSITEFWRRWHISLGSWFREYVYIPLGGNRVSVMKHIRNLLIVWILTGFWHGAAWNFMAWGLYYGILLILEKYIWGKLLERLPNVIQHIYSIILIMIGWALFSAPTMAEAFTFIGVMFGVGGTGIVDATTGYYFRNIIILAIVAIICSTPVVRTGMSRMVMNAQGNGIAQRRIFIGVYIAILLLSTAYLVNATYNPFLYFRF